MNRKLLIKTNHFVFLMVKDLGTVFFYSLASKSLFLFNCYFDIYFIFYYNLFLWSDCLSSYSLKKKSSSGSFRTYFFFTIYSEFFCKWANDCDLKLSQLTTIDLAWLNGLRVSSACITLVTWGSLFFTT